MTKSTFEERYLGEQCLLSEVRAVGHVWNNHPCANTLEPHLHEGVFEICYIADGATEYWIGSRTYKVRARQLFVTLPSELHGGVNATTYPGEIYWLQAAVAGNIPFAAFTLGETQLLARRLWQVEQRSFESSVDLSAYFERVLQCLRTDSLFQLLSLRLAVSELLLRVAEDAAMAAFNPILSHDSSFVKSAKEWIDEHLTEDFTTADVAEACGISDSYLRKLFSDATGRSPAEYRAATRIELAKKRIEQSSESVTRIAFDLGFSSSQYFATVFKAFTGITPQSYRTLSRENRLPQRFVQTQDRLSVR